MKRKTRAGTARETVDILEEGSYTNSRDKIISLQPALKYAVENTVRYYPEDGGLLQNVTGPAFPQTIIEVTPETTFAAAHRLVVQEQLENVCCLNFASAKNPGGGFLKGSQAQEESLARASALYSCLGSQPDFYLTNRAHPSCLYTDNILFSPQVPVFRNDADELLDNYYCVSVITAPAVNTGAVKFKEPQHVDSIAPVMLDRIERLLAIAVAQRQSTLILGAWGCGVFRNKPEDVATWFAAHLLDNPRFRHAFSRIVFAIYDSSDEKQTLKTFESKFSAHVI
ncbi:TIGR02452 family protein [Chitinophaga solisilvae]|uniref:TIGR02452 family protein n=1 Tax=Chitinophaga solisilvae TaxID=1233460 RepID=UPI001368AE71|nr:TIGR02452 family protein [Chitinophaga solisilvae]